MKKSTLIAVVVFAVLLVGALAVLREKPERGITRLSLADVEVDEVTRLETSGKNELEITKESEVWKLADGKRADAAGLERLLAAVPKIQSSTVVTRNPERFADLEVDDAKGTTITLGAGERDLARFTVGKLGRGGTYVRSGDDVYLVRGVYPAVFARDPEHWIEKKLFDLERTEVEKIEVSLADGTRYALVEKDAAWALEDPSVLPPSFRFDPAQAQSLANQVLNARASEVLDQDPGGEKTGLAETSDSFTIVAKDGRRSTLRLGGETETEQKNVYARADGWNEVVTLSGASARGLRKRPTDLRDLTLMDFATSDVVALEITNGTEQLRFERGGEPKSWTIAKATEKTPEGFELDPSRVEQRVSALRSSRALAAAPQRAEKTGLDAPGATVGVTTGEGETMRLAFGTETKWEERDAVYALGNADAEPYLVATFLRESLTGGLPTFAKQDEPAGGLGGFDAAGLQNLPPDVRAKLLRQLAEQQKQQAP